MPPSGRLQGKRFAPRYFHALLNALSSPRGALTAVFGMGTGVSPPQKARTKRKGQPEAASAVDQKEEERQRGRRTPARRAQQARLSSCAARGRRVHGQEARASFAPGPPPPRFPRSGDGPDGVQASRPIRSGRLNALRRLRLRPVKRVVFPRPSGTCVRDG